MSDNSFEKEREMLSHIVIVIFISTYFSSNFQIVLLNYIVFLLLALVFQIIGR